ncbi:MAG: ribosome-associated translation inhibitor RaiA [Candidatus Hatepunaea meridiana]|nr:ribosome-associated translation inhibitor RaiA [Candidatus Hatepunaea meridiana]
MKITFSARSFEATEKLENFATEEVGKLSKYLNDKITSEIILKENGTLKVVDIRLNAMGRMFKVNMEDSDFYKIIPKAVNKLGKQMKSQKSKFSSR